MEIDLPKCLFIVGMDFLVLFFASWSALVVVHLHVLYVRVKGTVLLPAPLRAQRERGKSFGMLLWLKNWKDTPAVPPMLIIDAARVS